MKYKGLDIHVEEGGWGWNVALFDGTYEVWCEVGYDYRRDAVGDAKYVADRYLKGEYDEAD